MNQKKYEEHVVVTSSQTVFKQPQSLGSHRIGARRPWKLGLCDCCSDIKATCLAYWCPCILLYMAYSKAGEGFCDCFCGGLLPLRVKVRTERAIEGSICDDALKTAFCSCCALVQVYHEVENTGPIV